MPNLGGAEILVILLVALLVLGPDKLPGAARSLGRGLAQLRRLSSGFEQEIRNAMGDADANTSNSNRSSGSNGVHPGLGPGPGLSPGAVSLGPASTSPPPSLPAGAVQQPVVEGPDESFS